MKIADIFVYPIKSLRGTAVEEALVCGYGLEHDRRWILVDADSKMITQREYPRLATLHPHVENGRLRLALTRGEVMLPCSGDYWTEEQVTLDVWGDSYVGVLASEASLDELNRRSLVPIPMNRFRPNLVISDARPFEEDFWQRVRIGDTVLRAVKACERCVITTVDQAEGVLKGPEPLKTLATFRRKGDNVTFGQYFRPETKGVRVRRGEGVRVLELKPEAAEHLPS